MKEIYLVLDNIRSVHNVGSILRTADAAGVKEVFLCGVTPAPVDRFGRNRKDLAKVSLGAEKSVLWTQKESTAEAITYLKNKQTTIVAIEQSAQSVPYNTYLNETPTAFVLGEETVGLPDAVLNQCDHVVEIPMRGEKESLNVSVAAGIVLFRFIE